MKPPAWLRRAALRAMGLGDVHGLGIGGGIGELLAIRHGASLTGYDDGESYAGTDGRPYRLVDGIAEFRVCGPVSKDKSFLRMVGLTSKPTLTEMAATVRAAALDDSVRGGMQYLDSPGGTVRGMSEYIDALAFFRARKPLHGFAETADSAAYVFGAMCQRLTISLLGEVGSIGVLYAVLDASQAGELAGLKLHLIRTGAVKAAGSFPLAGFSDQERAAVEERAEETLELSLRVIAEGRPALTPERVRALQPGGATYGSGRAVALGLVDAAGTYGEAMAALAAAVAAVPPLAGSLAEPEGDEEEIADEPAPPMPEAPAQETAMADTKAGAPAGTGQPEDEGFWTALKQKLGIGAGASAAAPVQPATSAAAAPPAGLTAEQVDERIARARAEDAVDAELKALASTVPPAVLSNARTRATLVAAKLEGPDAYAHQLGLVKAAGAGAAELLGGPVADAANAGDGIAKTHHTDMLARAGITAEREAELLRRYPSLGGKPSQPSVN